MTTPARYDWVDDTGSIDLGKVVARLWARRVWIVLSIAAFTIAFVAAALLTEPVYRAKTVFVSASSDREGMGTLTSALGQLGGLASLAGLSLGSSGAKSEEALAVLRSRAFTERFIDDEHLMPILFARQWDPVAMQWRGAKETWPTPAKAYKLFDDRVRKISQDVKTGLITLQIEWNDPILTAQWANGLVVRLNAEMRARAIESTNASVGFLEQELSKTAVVETRQAIARLMEAQINQRMIANVTKEYAFRVADKAMPSDRRDVVRPNKLLLFALGPTLGFSFGALVVLLFGALPKQPTAPI
jgi:uncharacterized protein involved in exopolysaccharide biosynthesis